jgi:uncharacterized lipoprotein YehR (DUF1307 family)
MISIKEVNIMKKALLSILLAVTLIASMFMLAGCGKDEEKRNQNPLVGSWEHSGYIYTFKDDNTGSYTAFGNEMNFTYDDDGSKVKILYKGNTIPGTYEYRIDGKKLIIKDSFGSDVVYQKK